MTVATLDEQPPPPPEDEQDARQPRARGSERAVLGCALVVAESSAEVVHSLVDELAQIVEPADMWWPAHERIWAALISATAEGTPCDRAAIAARVRTDGAPNVDDVIHALIEMTDAAVPVASAPWHARKVAEAAVARRTAAIALQLHQRALTPGFDQAVDVGDTLARLESVTGAGPTVGGPVLVAEVVEAAVDLIERPERIDCIPSGLDALDMIFPGARPGQMIVIGARPSIGKSVFALTISAEAAIRLHLPTLMFSLEMNRLQVTQRLISARAAVDLSRILAGTCTEGDWERINKHLPDIIDAPLTIDDTAELTITDIRARVRRAARRGLRQVVLDYLQLVSMSRAENRQVAVSEVSRQLKVLAGDVGVPIYVLCQLNRGTELRGDKRPVMSDLRESGSLEQDADVVVLLHRPDHHAPEKRPGECDLIVAKHRNGKTGTASVAFQGHYSRMASMTGWADA